MSKLLEVKHLSVDFHQGRRRGTLVDDVSFHVQEGECLGILGESGSGKSMTCKGLLGLLDKSFTVGGQALFQGQDLLKLDKESQRRLRGKDITMILQNSMSCFDPLYRIGSQMTETFREHTKLTGREIEALCLDTLKRMQIREPAEVLQKYPHQLSGGMLQRVMIGIALAMKPKLLVADEPTTAIDSITQYEIIKDLLRVKEENAMAMIFISHDLGVLAKLADRMVVMHEGKAVEQGTLDEILQNSRDAYTTSLIQSRMLVVRQFNGIVKGGGSLC